MREHDLQIPIIVNEKMQIIDGQNRLEARRILTLPVPYIIATGMTLSDVQKINSTSKLWNSDDYTRSFIEQGNEHYRTYQDFRTTYGLPHEVSILLLAGRGSRATRRDFIRGEFRIHDLEGARTMGSLLQTHVRAVWPLGWKDSYFVRALYIANSRIGFEMDRFISALPAQRHLLQIYRSVDQFLLMIEDIYNSVAGRKKVAIRYGQTAYTNLSPDNKKHAAMSDAKRKSMGQTRQVREPDRSQKILDAMADGEPRNIFQICEAIGLPNDAKESVAKTCSYLRMKGELVRVEQGIYKKKAKPQK
jgi:hypothetical protein